MCASTKLADAASEIAMRAAADYVRQNKLSPDLDALVVRLKVNVPAAVTTALADAKEALACGMGKIAEATFALTMRQAGIQSVKETIGGVL